jgi:FkbM family methyltransferase
VSHALKYAYWCLRHPRDLAGLARGASLRDLVLRSDLVRLGIRVPYGEARGFAEASFKATLVPLLREALRDAAPATVLDVGAQYGQFARAAAIAFPGCRVVAFEPLRASIERLRRAVGHRPDIQVLEFALGDRDGEEILHVSRNPGSSSVLRLEAAHVRAFPGTEIAREERIRVRRLDTLVNAGEVRLDRPVLMKVDVQGFEARVFEGCGTALDRVDALIVEMSLVALYAGQPLLADVRRLLESRGLRYAGEFDRVVSPVTGDVVQVDGLFLRG